MASDACAPGGTSRARRRVRSGAYLYPAGGELGVAQPGAPLLERAQMVVALAAGEDPRRPESAQLALAGRRVVGAGEARPGRGGGEEDVSEQDGEVASGRLEGLVLAGHRVVLLDLVETDAKLRPPLQGELEELHEGVHRDRHAPRERAGRRRQGDEAEVAREQGPRRLGARADDHVVARRERALRPQGPAQREGRRLLARLGAWAEGTEAAPFPAPPKRSGK